jgi:ABC-type transport system substrate-binding protein
MPDNNRYWNKFLTRRQALRLAAGSAAFGALSLAGCGGGSSGSGGGGGEIKDISNVPRVTEEDSKKGKPGGRLVIQPTGYATTLVLVTTNNNTTAGLAGFTHSGLLSLKNGRPIVDGSDVSVQPDLAVALPERPDQMTYIFKLNDAKFHNGRAVTSEDVKYSLERYAFASDSAYKQNWTWLDKVDNPDSKTVIVKTKAPYADAIGALCGYQDGFIMAKEHEESAEAKTKLMGSGPFLFVNTESPVITRFKKNPDYFMKPYPYPDEIHMLGNADFAKRYADFAAKNNHVTYWHAAEERDQLRQARPDAKLFQHQYAGYNVFMRTDQAPFKDERVRQALSMAIDRKAIQVATSKGEGEPDQAFSWTVKTWGFRKPSELGTSAKFWNLDVAEAKKLMTAAGVTDLKTKMSHWDPTVIGQAYVDQATLIQTQWRQNLGVQTEDVSLPFAQMFSTAAVGNYEGTYFFPGGGGVISAAPGVAFKNSVFSPPEGVTPPTPNTGHINDAALSAAAEKQATQVNLDERKATFKVMEEIMASKMYRITTSTFTTTYLTDPKVQNIQMPITATNSALSSARYWWFE